MAILLFVEGMNGCNHACSRTAPHPVHIVRLCNLSCFGPVISREHNIHHVSAVASEIAGRMRLEVLGLQLCLTAPSYERFV